MRTAVAVAGVPREIHPIVREEAFRIAYEAIRNSHAHSGGSHIQVELKYTHDLMLLVRDDGKGIDPTTSEHGRLGHFGLQGMRERARRVGGKLTIAASASGGTEVILVIPGAVAFVTKAREIA
jgi:signal transduction histidine kinase